MNIDISKKILNLTIPVMLANAANNITGFINTLILTMALGAAALSASALIYSSFAMLMMVAFSFMVPVSILIGQAMGAAQPEKVKQIFYEGVVLTILFSLLPLLLMRNAEFIFTYFRQPKEAAVLAGVYYDAISYGFIPMLACMGVNQLCMGLHKAHMGLIFSLFGCSLNVLFTYLLVQGHWGFPALGIRGAGLAFTISYIMAFIVQISYLILHPGIKHYQFFKFSWKLIFIKRFMAISIPLCIQRVAELLVLTVLTLFMGVIGHEALAAQQIVLQISTLFLMVPMGFLQACGILTGAAFAQKNYKLIKQYTLYANLLGTLCILILACFCWTAPQFIIHLFVKNNVSTEFIHLASVLLYLTAFTHIFDNIRNTTIGALRGMSDAKIPMYHSLIALWVVGVPCSYLFAFIFHLNAVGVNLGFFIGIVVGTYLIVQRFIQKLSSVMSSRA